MPPSARFLNNNPGYLQQGQRPDYYNARGGPGSIDAHIYPEGRHLMGGGIDALKLVNSPYGRQRGIGYRQAEEGVAGMRRDLSDPNRPLFDLNQGGVNPYGGGNQAPQQAPQGPNEDQQRWAQKFAEPDAPVQAPAQPATPISNSLMNGAMRMPTGGGDFVRKNPLLAPPRGELNKGVPTPPSKPLNFSRSALVEGAKKSGELPNIVKDYNAKGAASGHVMDDNGIISYKPEVFRQNTLQPQADEIRARRNFERGESLDGSVSKGVGALTKINPYGTASSTFAPSTGVRQGMMPDPLNPSRMIPMRQWAADQSAVQATKYGPDAGQAGENYLNKQSMAKSIASAIPATSKPSLKMNLPLSRPSLNDADIPQSANNFREKFDLKSTSPKFSRANLLRKIA